MYKPKSLKNILLKYMKGYGNSKKKLFHSWISILPIWNFVKNLCTFKNLLNMDILANFQLAKHIVSKMDYGKKVDT